jgi:hypothetical protein
MYSTNARILQREGNDLTLRFLNAEIAESAGHQVKVNGLKFVLIPSLPSKEADNDQPDLTNALVYRLADGEETSSLTAPAVCEVTWE